MQARGVVKNYLGTQALKGVDFDVWPGRVNALIGENGAGKSTLMKILAGIEKPTEGRLFLEGGEIHFSDAREAGEMGVGIIHQELNLFRDMTVADNMFAGHEIARFGVIDRGEQRRRAREVLTRLQQDRSHELMLNIARQAAADRRNRKDGAAPELKV
jgi:erythritol transport system ATP-binding protein